ncbi:twin-arginine translocation signal domain-containing protein [Mesorhizobium sp. BHbdii]
MRYINRRDFFKTSALAGAAIGLSSPYVRAQSATTINMVGWNSPKLMDILSAPAKRPASPSTTTSCPPSGTTSCRKNPLGADVSTLVLI